ncbi:MAG TPA: CPBP family intramembrane glutamic endopeptidase [Mycobacterium sp.]|nr:CPBP family intramembrane glutamic endopeptidase [Mycobacterium sp.]
MRDRRFRRLGTLSSVAALVGWSFASPRLSGTWRVTLQAGVGALLAVVARAPLGLCPPRLWVGMRLGSAAGVAAASVIAAATSAPPVRLSMAARELPASVPGWLLLRIPVGTVWAEEAAFRGALATAGRGAFGEPGGRLLQAVTFGLFHIADARATGEPVVATVLVTAIGGWLFGWLADRSGSLAAPMLAHLAINEAGAIAALTVRRSQQ